MHPVQIVLKLAVLELIHNYYKEPKLSLSESTVYLRKFFFTVYMFQIALAAIVSLIFFFFSHYSQSGYLIAALLFMSLLMLPVAYILIRILSKQGGKKAAISVTISTAIMFSNPAWFAGLGFITSRSVFYLVLQVLILAIYYAIGILACGNFAKLIFSDGNSGNPK